MTHMASKSTRVLDKCVFFTFFFVVITRVVSATLQAYGCDVGWSNFREHCYLVTSSDLAADSARTECRGHGGQLASVWSPDEREFILSLWRFPASEIGFLWLGVRGSPDGNWENDDDSDLLTKPDGLTWSVLSGVPGVPASVSGKCVAIRKNGVVAFLDCPLTANAYVCKKALPKVYVTRSTLNNSDPEPDHPMSHVQMFERMFPPNLTALPGESSRLAEISVPSEVGCAYKCFSVNACQVFQVTCLEADNCASFRCVLFSDLADR